MSSRTASVTFARIIGAFSVFFLVVSGDSQLFAKEKVSSTSQASRITIDYPLEGSVFPPEFAPPTFLWRDGSTTAARWIVEVSFDDNSNGIRLAVPGEHMKIGEIDRQADPDNEFLKLTPEQAATRTWRPDAQTWSRIKTASAKSAATIVITGFADAELKTPVSRGSVAISTSSDAVGAPVFYRDVPLMLSPPTANGSIQPLPPSAIPLIKWKLRSISEPQSRTVMENLPTCANCHSFSREAPSTFGMDVDGPKNDKGLYAILPVTKNMVIRNQDVIRWSSFQEDPDARTSDPAVKRFGFMSQVSPNGRYVVTSIAPPGLVRSHKDELSDFVPGLSDRLFSMNYSLSYKDLPFAQVFYPTRGILAWYDQKAKKLRPLPGADDPRFVHTSAFWSPDGKYLVFSRAEARDPYPSGAKKPEYANDPNETQLQYDLYRIPFNEGKGGKAEPVVGASRNGMSNNFPKVSPDGRWIVFVQNRNGLLMRPDSKLYIVPFSGGKARLMKCNTSLMNSWHTFSPNGRWLAFSSKSRSPYTQLMLTHIDADGNSTPAILVENTTAANRAVNIPEFVNLPADGLEKIDPQATEFYRLFNKAFELMDKEQVPEAIEAWRRALEQDPDDAPAHYGLALALTASKQERDAVEEYRKACELNATHGAWFNRFAVSLALTGNLEEAVVNWRKALDLGLSDAQAEADLGTALFELGREQEGYEHLQKAIRMAPDSPDAHNHLGWELGKAGRLDEAVQELRIAISLRPTSVDYRANLSFVLGNRGDFAGAAAEFRQAVELGDGQDWQSLAALAHANYKMGLPAEAIKYANQALNIALQKRDEELERNLRSNIERYERSARLPLR
jgi:Flp pilus assembly protein TadD